MEWVESEGRSEMLIHRCRRVLAALLVMLPSVAVAASAKSEAPAGIHWQPYVYETRTGDTVSDGEIGRLTVPERHGEAGGHPIDLAFIRFRSTAAEPGPPIIWLAGGPSDHGSDDIEGPYLELVRRFQEVGDVIALDQRGTGLTRPRLDCPENDRTLPLGHPLDPDEALAAYLAASRDCAEYFEGRGIDLAAYNTRESAADVDSLRRALGVPRIHLYGASYGSHLAFAVLREFPESVDRVVVSGIEGPDHTWKLPSNIDRFFEHVFTLARENGAADGETDLEPDLGTMVRDVLARLEASPVTVTLPGEGDGPGERMVIGAFELRLALRAFLGSTDNLARMPLIFADLQHGDFEEVARYLRQFRSVGVGSAMYYCMDCASGATDARRRQIAAEADRSLSGAPNFPFPDICDAWPHEDLGDGFRAPLRTDRPTLFLSATLDGHTPPSNTEEVAAGFTRATHVLVRGASHQGTELTPPELPRRLATFFAGGATRDTTFTVPFAFLTAEEQGQ
jgi:pimeloyl-ACP methyl ester carboxylesterase